MNRSAFYLLLQRYLDGHCTEEEEQLVEQWYELLDDDHDPHLPEESVKETVDRLWLLVKEKSLSPSNDDTPGDIPVATIDARLAKIKSLPLYLRWLTAAAVLVLIGWGIIAISNRKQYPSAVAGRMPLQGALKEFTNNGTSNDTVVLWDNSVVILEPHSTLYLPLKQDSLKREVFLEGNAFFTITRNKRSPFYVFSRNIIAQVLGTSFYVRTNSATNDTEVSVCTGKVAVYENPGTDMRTDTPAGTHIVLQPNQKTIYQLIGRVFTTSLADAPLPLAINGKKEELVTALDFEFDEAPISTVLAELEAAYRINIQLENNSLGHCLFSGDIKGQNLYDQLDIICAAVQATYEIKGTSIVVKGSPAN